MNEHRTTARLLQQLGETVAGASTRALGAGTDTTAAAAALVPLEALGVQLQSLARVLGGRGQMAPERIDIGMALLQLRAEWDGELQRRGATVDGPVEPLEVRICAGVLKQVLDLMLGHALALGRHIRVALRPAGQPPLPTLEFEVHLPDGVLFGVAPEALDELQWSLLGILTEAEGLRLERRVDAHRVLLSLGLVPSD